jgi:hypothetical protein
LSEHIHAMRHEMHLSSEAKANGAFQGGRKALPRVP